MLIDGLTFFDTSDVQNFSLPMGANFPTGVHTGEVFILTQASGIYTAGLYFYNGGAWVSGGTGTGAAAVGLAPTASPTFTGTVTVPFPVGSDEAATKGYVDLAVLGAQGSQGAGTDITTDTLTLTGAVEGSAATILGEATFKNENGATMITAITGSYKSGFIAYAGTYNIDNPSLGTTTGPFIEMSTESAYGVAKLEVGSPNGGTELYDFTLRVGNHNMMVMSASGFSTTFIGTTNIGSLIVTGNTTLNSGTLSTLNVSGTSTLAATSATSLSVNGSTTLNSVSASTSSTGATTAASLTVNGHSSVSSFTASSTVTVPTPVNGTDAATKAYVDSVANSGPIAFSTITSKPTTIAGYGITDAYSKTIIDNNLNLKANLNNPTFTGVVTAAAITATGATIGFPYDVAGSILGTPASGAVVARFVAARALSITSTSFNASIAKCASVSTGTQVLTVYKNGSNVVGTITFTAGATTGTWSYSGNGAFAIGDILTVSNQPAADASFGDAEFTILAVTA